jgi:hypothetical protein
MDTATQNASRSVRGKLGRYFSRRKTHEAAVPQNRRTHSRFPCELPVELHLETPGNLSILNAVARDISRGGMLVECPTVPAIMSACYVTFRVPDWGPFKAHQNELVMAQARVQHCNPSRMSFGLAFANAMG